ncbi:MAG: mechanosensitive ion channel domain-containing protein [Bacteroidota bacterium]
MLFGDVIKKIEEILHQFTWLDNNIKFLLVIVLAVVSYYFTKKIVFRIVKKLIKSTNTKVDDIFFGNRVLSRVSYFVPLFIINSFSYLLPEYTRALKLIISSLGIFIFISVVTALLTSISDYFGTNEKYKERPVKGYFQVVIIILYIFGSILIIGNLIGESPWTILTGLGALTAVLLLVFRDTILSLVASIQISSYDLVKVGDWIEVPKYSADGDVIDISLNVIKIQNWDKSITVIPTYKLLEDSFKNWRGMTLSGGRRIKRAVFVDQSSVKFCTKEMLEKFSKFQLIKEYLVKKLDEINEYNKTNNIDESVPVNGRHLTNLGTFRAYLIEFLSKNKNIRKDLSFIVRQLPPGPEGIPIEIYVFAGTTNWTDYENIQADIFDHILAATPEFELRIFQNPTGNDFRNSVYTN